MNPPFHKRERSSLVVFLVFWCLLVDPQVLFAALHPPAFEKIWTGLQQEGKQFNRVTFTIDSISPVEGAGGISYPLQGTLSFEPAQLQGRRRTVPQTVAVQGRIYPAINLLRFEYNQPRRGKFAVTAVLVGERDKMALIYEGRAGTNMLPFYLVRGESLPPELAPFATSRDDTAKYWKAQDAMQASVQALQEKALAYQELNNRLRAATRAGDTAAVGQIREEIQALQQELRATREQQHVLQLRQRRQVEALRLEQRARENPELARVERQLLSLQDEILTASQAKDRSRLQALSQQVQALKQQQIRLQTRQVQARSAARTAGSNCPEIVLNWASELEKNGASAGSFKGLTQLINLFRPSVFRLYFAADLFSMDAGQRNALGMALQRDCTRLNTDFSRGANITSVAKGFAAQGHGLNFISAAIGGEALDLVDQWLQETLESVVVGGRLAGVEALAAQGQAPMRALWPRETQKAKNTLTRVASQVAREELTAKIDILAAGSGTLEGLRKLARVKKEAGWKKLTPADADHLTRHFHQAANAPLGRYLNDSFPASANNLSTPRRALQAGKQWYLKNSDLFSPFAETDGVQQLLQRFWEQRERMLTLLLPKMQKEVAELESMAAVDQWGTNLILPEERSRSRALQQLGRVQAKRKAILKQQAFAARVGDGPFKAEHPGAVYLNALYRNDWKTIREEDRSFALPIARMMQPMNDSGIYELMAMFSGGQVQGKQLKNYMQRKMETASMATSLAGFYVLSLASLAPQCLGENPIQIERIKEWDEVLVNGYGVELSRIPHSETTYYTIARRHRYIFDRVKDPANAESLKFVNSLLGQFGVRKGGVRTSLSTLSENLRGLRMAMQHYPCNGEVMQQIEAALLKKAAED